MLNQDSGEGGPGFLTPDAITLLGLLTLAVLLIRQLSFPQESTHLFKKKSLDLRFLTHVCFDRASQEHNWDTGHWSTEQRNGSDLLSLAKTMR